MAKNKKPSEDELSLFLDEVLDAKPLKPNNRVSLSKPKPSTTINTHKQHAKAEALWFEPPNDNPEDFVTGEQTLCYRHSSISSAIFRKLKRGDYPLEDHLDLHGMKIEEAKSSLSHFLANAAKQHYKTVRIVHGKGHHSETPVLKNHVNHWLQQIPTVLAFCSASQKYGGSGAVYVLLARTEEISS